MYKPFALLLALLNLRTLPQAKTRPPLLWKLSTSRPTAHQPLHRNKLAVSVMHRLLNGLLHCFRMILPRFLISAPKSRLTKHLALAPPISLIPFSRFSTPHLANLENWLKSWPIYTKTSQNDLHCSKRGMTGVPLMRTTLPFQVPVGSSLAYRPTP